MNINEEKLDSIIQENINKLIIQEHRNLVYELDTALDIIDKTWKSPEDCWWVKIEARYKDYRHFNARHNYDFNHKKFKYWQSVGGADGTKRENHVGYVIVRGYTKEAAMDSLKNAVVHLNPWAAREYGSKTVKSQGHMEGIVEICNFFFARAYMIFNPHNIKAAIDKARDDKRKGLFKGREFHHRIGQSKEENDGTFKWKELRPMGLIDCDVDNEEAQKELEAYLEKNGLKPLKTYLSHDGKHYIMPTRDAEKLNFDFMKKYNSQNRPNDPNCLFKGDANMILYSPTGI